jgi:hypothetical protein
VRQAARNEIVSWFTKVEAAARLELSSSDAFIIWDMLSPKGIARPTATELVKRLRSELYRRNYRPQAKEEISDRVTGGGQRRVTEIS